MTRKLLALIISFVMVFSLFAVNVMADNEAVTVTDKNVGGFFFLTDLEKSNHFTVSSTMEYVETVEDGLAMSPKAGKGDPKCTLTFSEVDSSFYGTDFVKYPIIVARVKLSRTLVEGESKKGDFFLTDTTAEFKDKSYSFTYAETTDWQTVIIDTSSKTSSFSELLLYKLRIDPCGAVDSDIEFIFQYVAFFDTMEAAQAFDGDLYKLLGADAPATEAPATEVPATNAPATDAPATDAPATNAPATDAPATKAPVDEEKGGCGSSSAIAQVMIILGAALVIKRRNNLFHSFTIKPSVTSGGFYNMQKK